MADGRVLFAGGAGSAGVVNAVDILGTNGAITAGPPMLQARSSAACALLQDGRVFVSGGNDGVNALASAEYFTPSTGVWTSAGSMQVARYGHTAAVDGLGAVLLAGGMTPNGVSNQLEVFRPLNNRFTVLTTMSSARTNYAITPIDRNRTLIAGGSDGKNTLNTIDIFDARTNAVTASGTMLTARSGFGAATLMDGTVMFTGGLDSNGNVLKSTEIYNAATQTTVAGPQLNVGRANHQAYSLPGNGGVMVFGGTDGQNALNASEIYEPWTGKFTASTPMNYARTAPGNSLLQPGTLVVAGGQNGSSFLASSEVFAYATILTGKPDYSPGSVASFSGSGWKPGETVALNVSSFPVAGSQTTTEFTATAVADGTGRIALNSFNVDQSHLGMKFLLTATGSQSTAQTSFTDGDISAIYVGNPYGNGFVNGCPPGTEPVCTVPYGTPLGFAFEVVDLTNPGTSPAGTVTISENNVTLYGSVTLNPTNSSITVPPDTGNFNVATDDVHDILSPGQNYFTLQYSGETAPTSIDASTTTQILITVEQVATQTDITTTPTVINYGQSTTLTATVTNLETLQTTVTFNKSPQGTVTFSDGNGNSCAATVTSSIASNVGTFSCQTPVGMAGGVHNFTASYGGLNGVWLPSQAGTDGGAPSVAITVDAVDTFTTIVPYIGTSAIVAVSPQVFPTIMTTVATVSVTAGSSASTLAGTVHFYDGTTDLCGVSVTLVSNGGAPPTYTATSCPYILAGGSHSLTATFSPSSLENFTVSNSGATPFNITGQATSTAMNPQGGSVSLGASQTLTATVSCTTTPYCGTTVSSPPVVFGAAVPTPSGTINFIDQSNGNAVINPTPIGLTPTGNTGVATFTTNTLTAGVHQIYAAYTPGTGTAQDFLASSSNGANLQPFTINAIPPTFTVSLSPPSTPTAYQALTFTVSANSFGGHVPTGTVQLTVTQTVPPMTFITTGQVALNNGSATFNTSGLPKGVNYIVTISYAAGSGEINFTTTTNALVTSGSPFNIGTTATTTTLTSSQNSPIQFGTGVTFTATAGPATTLASGSPAPTGFIEFLDNGVVVPGCGTASGIAVNSVGSAQCTPSPLMAAGPASPHPITAVYLGDSNFTTSTSPTLSMTVNPATTTTTVSANVNTINLGGQVTYTVSVQGSPVGAGNPAGTVAVTDNATSLTGCVITLTTANPATGSCTLTYNGTAPLTGGTHSIVATFTPSLATQANWTGSTSTAITETVNQASTTIGPLTTTPATTAVYNDGGTAPTITIPFSFGNTPPPAPSQMFQVYDTGTLIGTLAVPATSPATFTLPLTTYQTVGAHTFVVKYPTGDPNYAAASSTGVSFTVTKFGPTVASSGFVGGNYGTAVTVGGSVDSQTPDPAGTNAAAPTGTLTFTFGTTTLGSCTLPSGGRICTLGVTSSALTAGSDTINIAYSGDANYASSTASGTLTIGQNSVVTATGTLTTSPVGTVAFGSPVQITVSLVPAGAGSAGTPTGTAIIYDQAPNTTPPPVSIGQVTLANGIGKLTTSSLVPGTHTLYATYSGDTNFAPILSYLNGPTVTLIVSNGNTTVTLTPSANPTALNQTISYNFTVTGGPSQPVGTVSLMDAITGASTAITCLNTSSTVVTLTPAASGNTSSGACTVSYTGAANTPLLDAGSHPITAFYTPTGPNASNWSSAQSGLLTEVVGQVAPTISQPVANPVPTTYGIALTYSVNLTPANPTPAYGASTVQFYDNGVPLGGPVSVSNIATGTFTSASTVPIGGSHSITAQFIGDTNYAASLLSPKYVFTIGLGTPTVTIGAPFSLTSLYYGMIGTTANPIVVTVAKPGGNSGVTPTGSVSLMAGTTLLATAPLSAGGTASFSNVQLPASLTVNGSPYSFFATYGGDGNWGTANSSSQNGTLTVNPAPAPVVVTASNNSPVFGQSVTLTATFNGPGNPVTGTLTFLNGTTVITNCVAVTVSNNVGTCTTSILPTGADTITVNNLAGDSNHTLGAITTTTVNVGTATTSTTLTSSANPSLPGASVTFTATINVLAPGNGTGTLKGTVTFTWGLTTPTTNILCSMASLNSQNTGAQATCIVPANAAPFTAPGGYLITATYNPGPSETNSTSSATITQTVGQPSPTFTSILSSVNPSIYGQTVTFTANFTVPGSTAPNGTVQFYDGANTLGGQQAISGGPTYTSSITVPSGSLPVLAGGNHTITALYIPGVGDAYASDNSGTQTNPKILIQVVNQAGSNTNTTTAPASVTYLNGPGLPNAPVYGEPITFTATITPVAPATGIPTGFAIFTDAGTQFGPLVPVNNINGVATATITTSNGTVPNLQVGTHSNIQVKYLGDTNFQASTSLPFPVLVISAAPTKTVLSPIPTTPQQYGTQITLTGQVCATQVSGAGAPTTNCASTPFPGFHGTMSFFDGGTLLNPGGTPIAVDPNSGTASISVTLTVPPLQALAGGVIVGTHSITAVYNGDVDFAGSTSAPGSLNVAKGSTSSSVTASVNPILVGQSVTFTGQVVAPGSFAAPPTGTVTFMDGGTVIGTAALATVGGVATAQFTVPNGVSALLPLTLGQHVISISYSGDANYASSATALSPPCTPGVSTPCALVETVNKAATTTNVSSNLNGSTTGQQVVLTATVAVVPPGAAVSSGPNAGPTGTVTFTNNAAGSVANVLGTGILTVSMATGSPVYQAILTLNSIPTGLTAITATYSGDVNYIGSSSQPLNQSVNKVQSTVTLTTSLNPSILGQPVTYTITVTPTPPGSGVPTGSVVLYDGANVLATLTLISGGTASYITALPVGGQILSAAYGGDLNFQPSTSAAVNEIVNKIISTLNLTSSVPAGAVASQVITFTAQIQPNPPVGVAYPTGQIGFFMDGATQIGAASLQSGVATLSTTLPAGNHQIQAFYIGDNNWTPAQSIYLSQIVGTATTTTQIVSSADPSVFGQAVVLTVTVAVPYPGTVPANGTVQLYDGGNAVGNPLPAGNGTFSTTLSNLAVGTHSIVAEFQSNGSFSQSSSAALSQIVNKAPTATALAVFPNSSTSNEGVTLTAVVTVPSPGATSAGSTLTTAPTGTVQFVNTTTNAILGSAPLNQVGGVWTATLNVTSLSQGSQSQLITATYSGDGNFGTSTSAPQPESVFTNDITVVNAAGYTSSNLAPNSFATIYGTNLAYTTATATVSPLPTSLSNATVTVTDMNGTARLAPLLYVSLSQINLIIPANTAYGLATVTVNNSSNTGGESISTTILVTPTAPGMFSENMNGNGVAAGYLLTVHADGSQSAQVPLFQYNPNTSQYVPIPISWNVSTDQQYLILYGTGLRGAAQGAVTATMNGISVPVIYSGAQPQFVAEDQVNMGPIPMSLKGAGVVNIVITANGQASNTVTVDIQ